MSESMTFPTVSLVFIFSSVVSGIDYYIRNGTPERTEDPYCSLVNLLKTPNHMIVLLFSE